MDLKHGLWAARGIQRFRADDGNFFTAFHAALKDGAFIGEFAADEGEDIVFANLSCVFAESIDVAFGDPAEAAFRGFDNVPATWVMPEYADDGSGRQPARGVVFLTAAGSDPCFFSDDFGVVGEAALLRGGGREVCAGDQEGCTGSNREDSHKTPLEQSGTELLALRAKMEVLVADEFSPGGFCLSAVNLSKSGRGQAGFPLTTVTYGRKRQVALAYCRFCRSLETGNFCRRRQRAFRDAVRDVLLRANFKTYWSAELECVMVRLLLCLLSVCVSGAGGWAAAVADEPQGIRLGDVCPEWKDLPGVDGRKWSRSDVADKSVLVLCFTCNSCPYSVDYEDRLLAFSKKYCEDGGKVALVVVNANRKPSETLEKMQERANLKGFGFPYVQDETQGLAAACGAVYTPEFFVFDHERKLIFKGAMDDRTNAAEVQVRHLENAVEAALKKEKPVIQEVPARGCAIPYRRARR